MFAGSGLCSPSSTRSQASRTCRGALAGVEVWGPRDGGPRWRGAPAPSAVTDDPTTADSPSDNTLADHYICSELGSVLTALPFQ